MQLLRGQRINETPGMSWTRSWNIAQRFAIYGTSWDPEIKRMQPREGQVIAAMLHKEIICAPCLLGHWEGEYIIDPRNVHVEQSWRFPLLSEGVA